MSAQDSSETVTAPFLTEYTRSLPRHSCATSTHAFQGTISLCLCNPSVHLIDSNPQATAYFLQQLCRIAV